MFLRKMRKFHCEDCVLTFSTNPFINIKPYTVPYDYLINKNIFDP